MNFHVEVVNAFFFSLLNSAGVALGDSWISPEDYVVSHRFQKSPLFSIFFPNEITPKKIIFPFFLKIRLFSKHVQFSWAPLLRDLSRLDTNGVNKSMRSCYLSSDSRLRVNYFRRCFYLISSIS